ncbi:MAG TPA: hypothetical protein VF174_16305, partial [Micromonosporaceae bacterium]
MSHLDPYGGEPREWDRQDDPLGWRYAGDRVDPRARHTGAAPDVYAWPPESEVTARFDRSDATLPGMPIPTGAADGAPAGFAEVAEAQDDDRTIAHGRDALSRLETAVLPLVGAPQPPGN